MLWISTTSESVWPRIRPSFAVERPAKLENMFGGEVGDLLAGGTIERLRPEIVRSSAAHGIDDGLAVRRKTNMAAAWPLEVEALKQRARIDGHNREFLDMLGEVAES